MKRICVAGFTVFAGLSIGLCGCGLFPEEAEIDDTIHIEHYEPVEHNVVRVKRGDLDESVRVTAFYEYTAQKDYYLQYAGDPTQWGSEIHNYVMAGDIVKKGDLLAEAPCDELEKQLAEYQTQLKEANATLSYNKKLLQQADDTEKESVRNVVKDSEAQVKVLHTRISEVQGKISDYQIHADMDGQVIYLADAYLIGEFSSSDRYITLASLDGVFKGTLEEANSAIEVGNTYQAEVDETQIPVKVESIDMNEEGKTEITFSADKQYTSQKKAIVNIVGDRRNNVCYLPEDAVAIVGGTAYVMVVGEDGFPRAKEVKVSGPVSDNYIIEEGLGEGDEVIDE